MILLTGASTGIGAYAAAYFAKIGYRKLAILARREAELQMVAAKCRENGAHDVLVLPVDLASAEASANAVKRTVEHFGSKYNGIRLS